MSSFYKEQLKTFLSAALASMSTEVVLNGVAGTGKQIDWLNATFNGLQTGTDFVAYPIATNLLEKYSSSYAALSKDFNDPKKTNLKISAKYYTTNALAAAALLTAVKYPLYLLQDNANDGQGFETNVTDFYANQVLPNIGYPVVANNLTRALPPSKNSLHNYLRNSFINLGGCFGGSFANLPLSTIRDKIPLSQTLSDFVKSIGPTICVQDFTNHFSSVLKSIAE